MVMTPEQSAKLKEIQFEMLKAFVEICEKENLTYWLIAGTALGAVRHKGFIPWDDDIDVGMPREDYERFLEIGQSYLPEYYFLQNFKTDPNYPINFAKIRDNRTTYIETSVAHLNMNHGVWIDIFPHDGFPSGKIRSKIFKFRSKLTFARLYLVFTKSIKLDMAHKVKRVLCFATLPFYPTVKGTVKRREKLFKKYSYKNSEYVLNNSGAWGDREIQKRENFGKGTEGIFEGFKVNLPDDWDKYLTTLYRDYMTPPPEEKRVGHHYAVAIDLEKPYTEYTK